MMDATSVVIVFTFKKQSHHFEIAQIKINIKIQESSSLLQELFYKYKCMMMMINIMLSK